MKEALGLPSAHLLVCNINIPALQPGIYPVYSYFFSFLGVEAVVFEKRVHLQLES
jgi:hypothetical protein